MRLSQAWIVARHDLGLLRRRRGIFLGLVAFPIGVGIGFPALVAYILAEAGGTGSSAWLPPLLEAFSFWFVIGSVSLPTSIASYSLVGEKVAKSLEPLLATPTTDGEILLGKSLAALLPTLGAMYLGAGLFQVLIDLETRGPFGYLFYPNWQAAVMLLLAMPLAALLAVEGSVIISSVVTDVRAAQQYAGIILFPFILLYIGAEIGFDLTTVHLLILSGILAAIDLALFGAALKSFHRDEILTTWK